MPKKRLPPGADDDAVGIAADDIGSHEADIRQVEGVVDTHFAGVRVLLRRHGLAGQSGLVDEKILGFKEPQVGRDHVSGGQPYHVARNQRVHGDFYKVGRFAVGGPLDARGRLYHGPQPRGGFVRAVLLNERRCYGEKDHYDNDNGGACVAEKKRDHCQGDEEGVERIFCPSPDFLKNSRSLLAGNEIESAGLQAQRSLIGRKAHAG